MGNKTSKLAKEELKRSSRGVQQKKKVGFRKSNLVEVQDGSDDRPKEKEEGAPVDKRRDLMKKQKSRLSSRTFQRFLSKADSFTIRSTFTNHFKLTSSAHHIKMKFNNDSSHSNLNYEQGTSFRPRRTFQGKDFHMERVLGKGGFGIVIQAKRKNTGMRYALKIQPIETMVKTCITSSREKDVTLLHMERTVLAICRGFPFIVQLEYAFLDDRYSVLALECITGGTLANLITSSPKRQLPLFVCKVYTMEIALAMKFMHDKGIIYRDLKPSNVLICAKTGHPKLSDFGLAGSLVRASGRHELTEVDIKTRVFDDKYEPSGSERIGGLDFARNENETRSTTSSHESPELGDEDVDALEAAAELMGNIDEEDDETSRQDEPEMSDMHLRPAFLPDEGPRKVRWVRRRTLCGTAGYRPPEQVMQRYIRYDNRKGYDERADWFALGSTTYTMLAGKRPFASKTEIMKQANESRLKDITQEEIQKGLLPQIGDVPKKVAAMAIDDAEFRSMMSKIRFCSRFEDEADMSDFVEKLLARNPHDRLNFEGIVSHPWMVDIPCEADELVKLKIPDNILKICQEAEADFNEACVDADKAIAQYNKKRQSSLRKSRGLNADNDSPLPTMFDYIDDLIRYETYGKPRYECRAIENRWYADVDAENMSLFEHWNFVSGDALKLEREAYIAAQARAAAAETLKKEKKKKMTKIRARKTIS